MKKYDDRAKEIGRRITTERERLKLSRKELLPKIYKSEQSHKMLASWEKGERLPDLDSLALMAELFDCDIGYLLGDYDEHRRLTADVCKETDLSEQAVSRIISYKTENPEYTQSLNFLLESDNFEEVLRYIHAFAESLQQLSGLRAIKSKQIHKPSEVREYKPNPALLGRIRTAVEDTDLCEYKLSTRMGFVIQEMRRKVGNSVQKQENGGINNG